MKEISKTPYGDQRHLKSVPFVFQWLRSVVIHGNSKYSEVSGINYDLYL